MTQRRCILRRMDADIEPQFRDLFPNLTPDALKEADKNVARYLSVVIRIAERIARDPNATAQFHALTGRKVADSLKSTSSDQSHTRLSQDYEHDTQP